MFRMLCLVFYQISDIFLNLKWFSGRSKSLERLTLSVEQNLGQQKVQIWIIYVIILLNHFYFVPSQSSTWHPPGREECSKASGDYLGLEQRGHTDSEGREFLTINQLRLEHYLWQYHTYKVWWWWVVYRPPLTQLEAVGTWRTHQGPGVDGKSVLAIDVRPGEEGESRLEVVAGPHVLDCIEDLGGVPGGLLLHGNN